MPIPSEALINKHLKRQFVKWILFSDAVNYQIILEHKTLHSHLQSLNLLGISVGCDISRRCAQIKNADER
jgi:hypothetical protein